MYDRRNADFADLSRRLSFGVSVRVPDFKLGNEATWPPVDPTTTVNTNIYESDVLVWMGDLNYRVDLPDAQIRSLLRTVHRPGKNARLRAESMALLQRHDQLKKAQRDRKAFVGFKEADISHNP
jgi:inositol polyphosphate 5-phosphatase INPP5B/F